MLRHLRLALLIAGICSIVPGASAAIVTDFTYTYDPTQSTPNIYVDSGTVELNDDLIGPAGSGGEFADPAWAGYQDIGTLAQPRVTLAFSQPYFLDKITITYYVQHNVVIHAPDTLDLSFSLDGSTYSAISTHTGFSDVNGIIATTFDLPGVEAQYLRASFYSDVPGEWVFLGEFDVQVPEPVAAGLMAVGVPLAMLRRRCPRRA